MTEPLRISRFLARCGIASRRKAEEVVLAGRVRVNGTVCTDLATRINPDTDSVDLDGELLRLEAGQLTLAFHKPPRVLVSRGDPGGRPTVYDLLPPKYAAAGPRLVYVGRLDFLTEGLLLLTTDGDLANRLTHPSHGVEKEYRAWTDRELTPQECSAFEAGVEIGDDDPTQPARLRRLAKEDRPAYAVVIREGRNRQVRRMFEALGIKVERLQRIRIGKLELGSMPRGAWRELTDKDIQSLF